MHHKHAEVKNFNIYYSQVIDPRFAADKGAQITIGDLHGNSMKLVSALVKHDILRISRENIRKLSCVYNISIDDLLKGDYEAFCNIIMNAEVNPEAKLATLRLIGDEFADRGMGDHFTFAIIVKLNLSGIPWIACFSNHPVSLIRCYENNLDFCATDVTEESCRSIEALQKCIKKGFISKDEVYNIIKNHYLPHIRIADYTISHTSYGSNITHYLHAPFDDHTIGEVARQLGEEYDADSIESEKISLDRMQKKFQNEYVETGKIATLVNSKETPVFKSIWNRKKDILIRNPFKKYVNGHHPVKKDEIVPANVVELDNSLDKNDLIDSYSSKESYRFLYTHDSQEFENEFLKECENIIVGNEVLNLFGKKGINFLLNVNKIYSRMQIRCLSEFLGDKSIKVWNELFKRKRKLVVQFIKNVNHTYELWDVLFFLKNHDLLNADTFSQILGNSINSEIIYQILLLAESCSLNLEKDVGKILKLKNNLELIYRFLIELRESQDIVTLKFPKGFASIVKESAEISDFSDKMKAVNALLIICNASNEEDILYETIIEFMSSKYIIPHCQDRVVSLFDELSGMYQNRFEHQSSGEGSCDSNADDEQDVRLFGDSRRMLESLLQACKIPHVIINTGFNHIASSGEKDPIEICLIELISRSYGDQCNIQHFLNNLLISKEAMLNLKALWPVLRSCDAVFFHILFNHISALPIIEYAKITFDIEGKITLKQILEITELTPEQIEYMIFLSEDLMGKNLFNAESHKFVFNNPELARVFYRSIPSFNEKLTEGLWGILMQYSAHINNDFYSSMMKFFNVNMGLILEPDKIIEEIHRYFKNTSNIRPNGLTFFKPVQSLAAMDNEVENGNVLAPKQGMI